MAVDACANAIGIRICSKDNEAKSDAKPINCFTVLLGTTQAGFEIIEVSVHGSNVSKYYIRRDGQLASRLTAFARS
jgi:hypothetical protein